MKASNLIKVLAVAAFATIFLASCNKLVAGGYTSQRTLTDDELALFEQAYTPSVEGYVPLTPKTVATQVVAGTNYCFVCKDTDNNTYEVVIYKPLEGQGSPEVTSITKK